MMSINAGRNNATKRKSDVADVIVKGAIVLVTVAIFLGAYMQFDVSILQSLVAAVGVFVASMALHKLVRRSERVELLAKEVIRLESEVANLTGRRPGPGPLPEPNLRASTATQVASPPRQAPVLRPGGDAFGALVGSAMSPPQRDAPVAVWPPKIPNAGPSAGLAHFSSAGAVQPQVSEPRHIKEPTRWPVSAPASEPTNDSWVFRPASGPHSERPATRDETPQPNHQPENDLEAVQGMLKKLAKEADVAGAAPSSAPPSEQRNEDALKASVDALYSAARDMRAADTKAPLPSIAGTQKAKGPLPPPIVPVHARLSALGEAISANRVDVVLDPILGLAEAKAHHHELVVSLRDPRGAVLPGSLRDPALLKTGLTPLLDSTRVRRAAEVATSLSKRGHKGSIFVATSAESLESDQFLDAFADVYRDRQELANQLVLSFSQSEVLAFSGPQRGALTDMRGLGFRFGLEGVSDLNFDFSALGDAGFDFLKLSVDVFRKGLPGTRGPVPANDICRYLRELGLTLIVGGIDHEVKRTMALDFGVQLGQGLLFGAPQAAAPQRLKGAGIAAA
ncbi:MAG: EAL domain-containing protein [Hyphomicrobium sp.]|nr:EAL domain-containing protein [Hyphomicrobium sp.]